MDSWTDAQLALMKNGGNDKCNSFLQKHGVGPRTPIKQKYESAAAQLYKAVLKARVEGRPEPTELPPSPAPRTAAPTPAATAMPNKPVDPNGMERLPGETEQQYVARQTRLRDEARQRMAAKFGNGGMGGRAMQGVGSDPSYNPSGSFGAVGGSADLISGIGAGLGVAWGTAASLTGSVAKTLQDESTLNSIKSTGASFWGSLTSSVSTVAASITAPDDNDGLADLQRQIAMQKPATSKYTGFGSSQPGTNASSNGFGTNYQNFAQPPAPQVAYPGMPSSGMLQEAVGLPHEDRNGVERLTGESDEQYVMRQTRLREEARARMAAKFGGGGLGGVGSNSMISSSAPGYAKPGHIPQAPASTGLGYRTSPARADDASPMRPGVSRTSTPPPKAMNSGDFFSSFGA